MAQRLDINDDMPKAMRKYLAHYGWHFNKALCDLAVSKMKRSDGTALVPCEKEKAETMFKQYGIDIPAEKMYDAVYVLNMARADFLGSSIVDEAHLAKYVQDYINDPDGYDGIALTRFYADTIGKGMPIYWEDVL